MEMREKELLSQLEREKEYQQIIEMRLREELLQAIDKEKQQEQEEKVEH